MSRKKIKISDLDLNKIGDRIAYLRLQKNMTQAQLAESTGLSKGNISGWESHKYEPSARAIIKFVELFEITADWILFGGNKKERKISEQYVPELYEEGSRSNEIKKDELIDITIERHRQVIERFHQKDIALKINEELADLEELSADQLKEILNIIKDRKFRLEQEAAKKRTTANEKD